MACYKGDIKENFPYINKLGGGKARLRHRTELCWEVRLDALPVLELVPAI